MSIISMPPNKNWYKNYSRAFSKKEEVLKQENGVVVVSVYRRKKRKDK